MKIFIRAGLMISLSFLLLVHPFVSAQDTTRVLFIGNSFTAANNLPDLFKQLSGGAGDNVVVNSYTPGGVSVGDTAEGTMAHMNNPVVYALIRSDNWDYLVLQDKQGRFALPYGVFPGFSKVIEGHIRIRDSLLYYHPCAHMIWFAGFGTKNGIPPYAGSGEAMIDSIYQNYQYLEDTAGQVMAPIGPAFLRIIFGYPEIDLWGPDEEHPSLAGSYLIATVLYSTIYKRSPMISSYNPGFPANGDSLLKVTGYQTTLDSLHHTGLDSITPVINQAGSNLSVSGFQSCAWFFNGAPYTANGCVADMTESGEYYALAFDADSCLYRTQEQYFAKESGINDRVKGLDALSVSPNPTGGRFTISSCVPLKEIRIYGSTGARILAVTDPDNKIELSGDNLPDGLYTILAFSDKYFIRPVKLLIRR